MRQRLALGILMLVEVITMAARRAYELGWLRQRRLGRTLQLAYRLGRFGLRLWRSGVREERSAILRRHFPL